MHNGMPYEPIQGQGQGHETFKVWNYSISISKSISSAIFNVSWQVTTDSETPEQYLNFVQIRFLISVLVFVSMTTNLEGSQISEESTAVPYGANFFYV